MLLIFSDVKARREAIGAVCVFLLAAALAPFIVQYEVDNRIEQWMSPNSDEAQRYQNFRDRFGSDEIVVIAYTGRALFDVDSLEIQVTVLENLEAIPEISSIFGIPVQYRDLFGMEDPDELEIEFTSTDFYRNFLISDDASMAGLMLETEPPDKIDGRRLLVHRIEAAVEPLRAGGWTTHIVGPPALNVSLDNTSKREAKRLIPLSLAISSLVLLLFLRSLKATIVGLACAAVTVVMTVGAMALFARPMNMVTISMPALVWVLSLAGLIHLLHAYSRETNADCYTRLANAIAKTRRPCAVSSITTACGFFSLSTAPLNAVQDFGLFAGLGLLISLVVTFTLATTLVRLLNIPARHRPHATGKRTVLERVGDRIVSRPAIFLSGGLVLMLLALTMLPRLQTESNPLNFLPASSDIAQSYQVVSDELTGLYSLELLVETPQSWLNPITVQNLDLLAATIEAMPEVARVISPVSYLRKLNQWDHDFDPAHYQLPDSEPYARDLLEESDDSPLLSRFALADESAVRLAVLVQVMESGKFTQLVDRVRALPELDPFEFEMTGVILQLINAQNDLVVAQIRSLGVAYLLIFPCILIGLRSLPLTLLAFALNSIPVLAGFALMGALNIPLDIATIMVAGIAIGIAVDDSVHMICGFQRAQQSGIGITPAIRQTLAEVGPSITITTLTALAGFFVLLRSEFIPLRHFGLIVGCTLIVAFVTDVLILPAGLTLMAGRQTSKSHKPPQRNVHATHRNRNSETVCEKQS